MSAVALYGIVAMVGIVSFRNLEIITHEPDPWDQVQALNWSLDFLAAVPIVIFGMQCHCQVITVFHELEDRPRVIRDFFPIPSLKLGGSADELGDAETAATTAATEDAAAQTQSGKSKKLRGMRRVVMTASASGAMRAQDGGSDGPCIRLVQPLTPPPLEVVSPPPPAITPPSLSCWRAVSLTAVGYAAIGLTGYLAFPHSAKSNILNNFSSKDLLMQVRGPGTPPLDLSDCWLCRREAWEGGGFRAGMSGRRRHAPASWPRPEHCSRVLLQTRHAVGPALALFRPRTNTGAACVKRAPAPRPVTAPGAPSPPCPSIQTKTPALSPSL